MRRKLLKDLQSYLMLLLVLAHWTESMLRFCEASRNEDENMCKVDHYLQKPVCD